MAKTEEKKAKKTKAEKPAPPAEVVKPLKVEINFPTITDLKQAIQFDSNGILVLTIQFKSTVDQFEIARLVNLLKQTRGALYAVIGTSQSAMDFKFDVKAGKVELIQAAKALAEAKPVQEEKPAADKPVKVKFQEATFNHIPKEEKPFGVFISYADGNGELHEIAGRGVSAMDAVIDGVKATGAVPQEMNEPFEILDVLKEFEETPALIDLIRVIEVGKIPVDKKEK